jgi:hypothetical protein
VGQCYRRIKGKKERLVSSWLLVTNAAVWRQDYRQTQGKVRSNVPSQRLKRDFGATENFFARQSTWVNLLINCQNK